MKVIVRMKRQGKVMEAQFTSYKDALLYIAYNVECNVLHIGIADGP